MRCQNLRAESETAMEETETREDKEAVGPTALAVKGLTCAGSQASSGTARVDG